MRHVLKLNRSSFYKWVQTREKHRLKMYSGAAIRAKITTIFDDEYGLYEAKRIAASLKADMIFGPINRMHHESHGTSKALPSGADVSLPGASLATVSCRT